MLEEPERNPNRMDAGTYARLVAAIRDPRVGFVQPVLARRKPEHAEHYVIVDGVHRVRAAREAGLVEVPIVVVSLDDDCAAAVQVGMNRMRGELDLGVVGDVVHDLSDRGWLVGDLALTGFGDDELRDLLRLTTDAPEDLGGGPPEEEEEPAAPRPFVLEVTFATRAELSRVKRGLRKAAGGGRGADMARGLLCLLDGA